MRRGAPPRESTPGLRNARGSARRLPRRLDGLARCLRCRLVFRSHELGASPIAVSRRGCSLRGARRKNYWLRRSPPSCSRNRRHRLRGASGTARKASGWMRLLQWRLPGTQSSRGGHRAGHEGWARWAHWGRRRRRAVARLRHVRVRRRTLQVPTAGKRRSRCTKNRQTKGRRRFPRVVSFGRPLHHSIQDLLHLTTPRNPTTRADSGLFFGLTEADKLGRDETVK